MINKVIDYLNETLGTNYKVNSKKNTDLINARLNDGFELEDFKKVIDIKTKEWRGTEFEKYLRPETIFSNKMQSYLNQRQTNLIKTGNREDLIKAVLKASGMRDITLGDITIYNEVLKLIPTQQLPQFAVSIIRSGGEFMRPDQMISKAVKEFETKILVSKMQTGNKIKDFDKLKEFIQYSFRNKSICNNLEGIYKSFVTIGMDRDGYLINQFSWKKLSSETEHEVYAWLYEHQDRIGIIESIDFSSDTKQIGV